jgi:hypothetical protein
MSDFDQVAATLPRVNLMLFMMATSIFYSLTLPFLQDLSDSPILMYDPLPPLDSTSGYSRPQRWVWLIVTIVIYNKRIRLLAGNIESILSEKMRIHFCSF